MATFRVPVVRVAALEPIPGADSIQLAVVGEYRSVVRIGQFQAGDRAVYIPEAAIVPDGILAAMNLTGKLAGAAGNRVKAIKLRGCLSQGLLYTPVPEGAAEGVDVADVLGITKWEPAVPEHMGGDLVTLFGAPIKYDIENFKAYAHVIADGEDVEFTEKAHGTFCGIGVDPSLAMPELFDGDGFVYSKGLGGKGLVFKNNEDNAANIYVAAAVRDQVHAKIRGYFPGRVVHVLGEVYGHGVQDLAYGMSAKHFAVFDIVVDGAYLDRGRLRNAVADMGLARVPVLYQGPFSKAALAAYTDGRTVLGAGVHIREGVVITPVQERYQEHFGRVILKSVSGDYLTRKGLTTEFS